MYFLWNLDKAVKEVKKINGNKLDACISFLPIKTQNKNHVRKNTDTYFKILDEIKNKGLNSEITLKLHQFGVYGDKDFMLKNIIQIIEYTDKLGNFVWIDMERPDTIDITIEVFKKIRATHTNVGICLQSCLKRTERDMKNLLKDRVPLRLVKGYYLPYDVKPWSEVTNNFSILMEFLLENSDRPCIATHDIGLLEKAKKIIKDKNIKNAEIQFFYEVNDKLARVIKKEGFNVSIYVPYGNFITYMFTGLFTFDNLHNLQRLLHFKKLV